MSEILNVWTNLTKTAQLLLTVAALAVGASFWHSCSSDSKAKQWRQTYENYRDTVAATTRWGDSIAAQADSVLDAANASDARADSLTGVIATRDSVIADLSHRSDSAVAVTDSTFNALVAGRTEAAILASSPPEADPWIRLAFRQHESSLLLRRELVELNLKVHDLESRDVERQSTILGLRTSLGLQTWRADSLQRVINFLPPPPPQEKLLGIIPLPSRKLSFLVGVIGGIIAYEMVDRSVFKE